MRRSQIPKPLFAPSSRSSMTFGSTRGTEAHRVVAIHVVLVHPEIHWNTGNAGRTCLAAGATLHLIEPLGFSLDERKAGLSGCESCHRKSAHSTYRRPWRWHSMK